MGLVSCYLPEPSDDASGRSTTHTRTSSKPGNESTKSHSTRPLEETKPEVSKPTGQKTVNEGSSKPESSKPATDDAATLDFAPFEAYLSKPEIQRLAKSKDELETFAHPIAISVVGKPIEEAADSLFDLLQIRVLQEDDTKANKIISLFLNIDPTVITNLLRTAREKNRKMTLLVAAAQPKLDPRNASAFQKVSSSVLEYGALLGRIKAKISAAALLGSITLPMEFYDL